MRYWEEYIRKKKKPSYCDDRRDSRLPWQRGDARDPLVCLTKSALHGNRQAAGGARQEPCAQRGGDTPSCHLPAARLRSCRGDGKLQPPKLLYSGFAPQQAPTNKSRGATNICSFSGACIFNMKILKALRLPHWHPAWCWLRLSKELCSGLTSVCQLWHLKSMGFGFMVESKNTILFC